ncbi:MAG: hypothetical protein CMJ76_14985 [Planctomycetaceae bacterium]|nr:hypothetical protein [Planctomycetaceae bacterium]
MSTSRFNRRELFQRTALGVTAISAWQANIISQAATMQSNATSCILLWMGGGPSQLDTWDPKPGTGNAGDAGAIQTALNGVHISDRLPETAKVINEICLLRGMHGPEGSHPRASYWAQTGYLPSASIKHPAIGSHVSHHIGNLDAELPSFVRVGPGRNLTGAGLLGVDHDPFKIANPNQKPANTEIPTTKPRFTRRLGLLEQLETDSTRPGAEHWTKANRKVYGKAARMITSPLMQAFDLQSENAAVRESYGESNFAAGCLMARRLIESGVTFVEVTSSNWDTHFDNYQRTTELCSEVDRPYARLLTDLKDRGLLATTLVVWMGEFGRTPRINSRGGRDHFPRAYSVALAGCGINSGQVIGGTSASGEEIVAGKHSVPDLLTTIYDKLGIDGLHENMSSVGRPIRIVENGSLIENV